MKRMLPWFVLVIVVLVGIAVPGAATRDDQEPVPTAGDSTPRWAQFEMAELLAQRAQTPNRPYLPFLRVPTLRAGIYELGSGDTDQQRPHDEDELYYVVKGRGMFRVDSTDHVIAPGSVLFVKANVEHRFHSITEDLSILVFFSSAQSR